MAHWTVGGKLFAWERPLRQTDRDALGDAAPDGPILGLRTADLEMKDALLGTDRSVFFTIPHFDGYAAVLIRLDRITPALLRDVLAESWLSRARKRAAAAYLAQSKERAEGR